MKIIAKYKTKIEKNKIVVTEEIQKRIDEQNGNTVYITIEKWNNKRSNQQNRYYWGCVLKLISEETGYTSEDLHDIFKTKYLTEWIILTTKKGEKEFAKPISTTNITTTTFNEYISKIVQFSSFELGLIIPEPHEVGYETGDENA